MKTRTIITISDEEKRWLAGYSRVHGVSVAEAVRRGIACLKEAQGRDDYRELVKSTAGIWKKGDPLAYQEKLRSEW